MSEEPTKLQRSMLVNGDSKTHFPFGNSEQTLPAVSGVPGPWDTKQRLDLRRKELRVKWRHQTPGSHNTDVQKKCVEIMGQLGRGQKTENKKQIPNLKSQGDVSQAESGWGVGREFVLRGSISKKQRGKSAQLLECARSSVEQEVDAVRRWGLCGEAVGTQTHLTLLSLVVVRTSSKGTQNKAWYRNIPKTTGIIAGPQNPIQWWL